MEVSWWKVHFSSNLWVGLRKNIISFAYYYLKSFFTIIITAEFDHDQGLNELLEQSGSSNNNNNNRKAGNMH